MREDYRQLHHENCVCDYCTCRFIADPEAGELCGVTLGERCTICRNINVMLERLEDEVMREYSAQVSDPLEDEDSKD